MRLTTRLSFASVVRLAVCVSAISPMACDEPLDTEVQPGTAPAIAQNAGSTRSNEWASVIQDSADAAFVALDETPARSETRVGPQPWPQDLPVRWPVPRDATVVADTKRSAGERLLLVNVPGAPDQAMDAYQSALRERGYDVDRPRLRHDHRALHAQNAEHHAVLTFFARENATRIEILFLARARG